MLPKSYADTVSLGVVCILVMVQRKDYISNKDMCQMVPGVWFQNKQLKPNERCVNDDELVLYLSKNYRVAKVILYKYHLGGCYP